MRYLPISLKIENSTIAVIGNGEAALNKLRMLVKTTARIKLYAPSPSANLVIYLQSIDTDRLTHIHIPFSQEDVAQFSVIFSSASTKAENFRYAFMALKENILFNSPDNPEICTFYVPSIVDRSPVTVAISTEGTAPVLAKKIRSQIEYILPQETGELAIFAQSLRPEIQKRLTNMSDKRHFWENFFNGNIADHFFNGDKISAVKEIEQELNQPQTPSGKLYIIHADEPDLLSLKAARTLQLADYVYPIAGKLSNIDQFTDLARRDAHFTNISSSPDKPKDGELIMKIAKQIRDNKIVVLLGDQSTRKRKNKIFNYLQNENIKIEQLYSAKPSEFHSESLNDFAKQYL